MLSLAQTGTPLEIPPSLHLVLWPALILWTCALLRRRSRPWPHRGRLAAALVPAALLVDSATLAASHAWPTPASNSFVFTLLWLAVLLSLSAYLLLRAPDEGGGGEGEQEPEPPWWPEFERQLRDYMRSRPRAPAGSPRVPAGTR